MDKAARRFASWVLGMHGLVFVLLAIIVILASREVYSSARRQALEQLQVRQELLASQSARGIEGFYRSILDTLELQKRADAEKLDVVPFIWQQLRGQATDLVVLDANHRVINVLNDSQKTLSPGDRQNYQEICLEAKPGVSVDGTLVTADAAGRLLVARIPLRSIESRFLNDLNQPQGMGSMLLNNDMRVVSAEDRAMLNAQILGSSVDPRIREMAAEFASNPVRQTQEFLQSTRIGEVELEPAIVTAQPVSLPDGKCWWLIVSSNLAEVDQIVGQFFRRAIVGAGLVILAMTGVLVSTSTQMIRGRLRLERMQNELLNRELAQAREIQLAWLPEKQENNLPLDIAAMNRPASHVSGDFYNWFELSDGRAVLIVGDVTGHGLPAAFLMATTQLLVRMTMERLGDAGAAMRQVNRQLCHHVFSGQFVTMIIVVIDTTKGSLEIATAGHPPPLIGNGENFKPLSLEPQLVLAVDDDVAYITQRFELKDGASLLLYTDGITDVQSPSGERLQIEGLANSLYGRFASAKSLLDTATDAIESFRTGREPADDLTMVAVQFQPAAAEVSAPPLAAASA